MSLIAKI